jgi:hypothetical protein
MNRVRRLCVAEYRRDRLVQLVRESGGQFVKHFSARAMRDFRAQLLRPIFAQACVRRLTRADRVSHLDPIDPPALSSQ